MTLYKLSRRGTASASKKLYAGVTAAITGTGTITTGLNNIEVFVLTVQDATAIAASQSQEYPVGLSVSGGTISIAVVGVGTTTAIAQSNTAHIIGCIAVGD